MHDWKMTDKNCRGCKMMGNGTYFGTVYTENSIGNK